MKQRYLVLIEKGPTSYGVFAPDVPGCGTSGDARAEAMANIREALQLHLEVMAESGEVPPEATYESAEFVEVDIPTVPTVERRSQVHASQ